jgi:hypothetical protein
VRESGFRSVDFVHGFPAHWRPSRVVQLFVVQPRRFSSWTTLREGRRFLAEVLDRLLRVDRLGRVDADEADAFDVAGELDLERVTVDDLDDAGEVGGGSRAGEQQRRLRRLQGAEWHERPRAT